MRTVAAKTEESAKKARELAIDLVRYAHSSGGLVSVVREREAELGALLLDIAWTEARAALDAKHAKDAEGVFPEGVERPFPGVGLSIGKGLGKGLLAGGAGVVTGEPCPACKGQGTIRRHHVVFPRADDPPRMLEAIRERDEARAERDAMRDRCADLEQAYERSGEVWRCRLDELEAQRDASRDRCAELVRELEQALADVLKIRDDLQRALDNVATVRA
jgi:hypothetical protein